MSASLLLSMMMAEEEFCNGKVKLERGGEGVDQDGLSRLQYTSNAVGSRSRKYFNFEHEPNKDKLRHWKVYKPSGEKTRRQEKNQKKKRRKRRVQNGTGTGEWREGRGGETYHSRVANNWWPWAMLQRCKLMWHPLEPELQPIDLALGPADELCKEREEETEKAREKEGKRESEREMWLVNIIILNGFIMMFAPLPNWPCPPATVAIKFDSGKVATPLVQLYTAPLLCARKLFSIHCDSLNLIC